MTAAATHRLRLALIVLALMGAWAAIVLTGAAHGFWRPPLAPQGDSQTFAAAAREVIDRDLGGNAAFALVEEGRLVGQHFASAGTPVTEDTVFQLASVSKWVAAWG